jgi:hypothetical protein
VNKHPDTSVRVRGRRAGAMMSRQHLVMVSLPRRLRQRRADGLNAPAPLPVIERASVRANRTTCWARYYWCEPVMRTVSVRFRAVSTGQTMDGTTARVACRTSALVGAGLVFRPSPAHRPRPGGEPREDLTFTTDHPPICQLRRAGGAPSPASAFAARRYGLVIDNSGRVVRYRQFDPPGPGLN